MDEEQVGVVVNGIEQDILNWAMNVLKDRKDLLDDYRELTELSVTFLARVPTTRDSIPGSRLDASFAVDV